MTQIYKDNNTYTQIKKELKKIETIIDNDLVNINENNYEYNMNKAKMEAIKFHSMVEEIKNNQIQISNSEKHLYKNSSNNSLSNNTLPEMINKINENIQENNNNSMNFLYMISKVYNKYIDLYKKYNTNSIEYEKDNILRNQKNIKNEEILKNNIISITNENINKFSSMCYNNNTNDLRKELKNLSQKANSMNSYDVLQVASDILGKLLLRTSSYKDEKELEIENLNGKIIYLLSELDIYKRNMNLNKENNNNKSEIQLLNNQLGLKEDEINRLNKDIEEYLVKIKELTCENNILKNNQKSKINNTINNENDYNNVSDINNKNKNINNIIKYKKKKNYQNNSDSDMNSDNLNDSDKLSEGKLKNDLAKKQEDIDKLNAQLRELNQLENGNMNNYENKNK